MTPLPSLVKVLIVSFYFPPAGGVGVRRALKFAEHLPELGIETHVLAPDDPRWLHRDGDQQLPPRAGIHRARYVGPRGRKPAEELHAAAGLWRLSSYGRLLGRRLIVPDENATWLATAIPSAIRLTRELDPDVILTTSPPGSVHLIGAAVKRVTGVPWVADLRDPLAAHPHRDTDRLLARLKDRGQVAIARAVSRRADAIVTVSEAIAAEMRLLHPRGRVVPIHNGADFDDFEGIPYTPARPFRITHTGSFFGQRDPRPFLSALARVEGVVARFVGELRARDIEWARSVGVGDRVELIQHVSHRRSLELQRNSEALLLLIPRAGGRGDGILSGKVFEYIAAGRPVLALVPPAGAAARLISDTGAGVVADPDDVDAIATALSMLRDRADPHPALDDHWRATLSRRARSTELAALLRSLSKREWPGDDHVAV